MVVDILKGEKAWSGVEVCLDEAASGQQSVSPHTESSLLSSDLSSAGLLGDRGLDFRCPGPVSLQADLLSPYKRGLTKEAERTALCFGREEVSSGLADRVLC